MINRRNVLIGLGTAVAAGGAAIGTGAFDQVEATRDVDIETTGDADAQLALELDESVGDTGDGDDVISVDISDLNERAKTTFEGALTVTNNGTEDIELEVDVDLGDDPEEWVQFKLGDTDLSEDPVGPSEFEDDELEVDIVFDLSGEDGSAEADGTVTIEANAVSD